MEILVVIVIVAVIAALAVPLSLSLLARGDRAKMTSTMRTFGTSIFAAAADRDGRLPGPLWPGQVAEYDRNREGRLIVELASYLGVEDRPAPYVPEKFFTGSLRRATRGIPAKNVRLFVMNMKIASEAGQINPWGSAADPIPGGPFNLSTIPQEVRSTAPAFSEADRMHPDVASAPWAASCAPSPPHGSPRLNFYFDGSVRP